MNTQILASSIEALGMVLAAIITMGGVLLAAYRVTSRRKLRMNLIEAYKDILTLYAIEKEQIKLNVSSNKITVRKVVENELGLLLSNKNTPARLKRKMMNLESMND
jgi:hypothetical protein